MSSVYNTLTQLQNSTNKINYERGRANLGSDKLDKTAFMQLMMAQLQYQDPTEPMDNSQFLQQQAMYSQTEAIQNLNDTLSLTSQITQATSMVGKYVEVGYMEDGKTDPTFKTGQVDSVVISNGQVGLRVGDLVYPINQVTKVYSSQPTENTSNSGMSLPDQIVAANKLQGKYIKFDYTMPGSTTPMTITGQVASVTNDAKKVTVKIGNEEFDFSAINVKETSSTPFTDS